VVLDLQHGSMDFAGSLRALPQISLAGKPALVRMPVADFSTASRFLDAGFSGIIAPMINTVEDARRFAGFMKFPPLGERSWGAYGALALTGLQPGDYLRQGNDLTVAFAMVETRESLSNLDEILAVPGIDGVFVGPSDLSIALLGGKGVDPAGPEVEKALDHVLARTKAAGKLSAIFASSGARAGELARKGFNMVSIGNDMSMLRAGAQAALAAARG
jgi:4-hydroxy-2-oxoheptanedioate aldolase